MRSSNRKSQTVTLADVARSAGLATMTVSRYLNGNPNIAPKTAQKVKKAIDLLGYRPNQAARMLMGQPSKVIGLILPNLANPFFASVAHSVQQTAHQRGYLVWIAATNDEKGADAQLIERMRDHHVDGILLSASPRTTLRKEDVNGVPVIALDRPVHGVRADIVTIEDRLAARAAIEHLLLHGYRRIACLGLDPAIRSIEERISGYQEAMQMHGRRTMPYVRCEDREVARKVIRKLMCGRYPVEAIFPANGAATILTLEVLNEMKVVVPDEVALFSFGDVPLGHIMRSPLSAVSQPTEALGEIATTQLLDLIAAKRPSVGNRTGIDALLVIRASCGCTFSE
jgi:LacI family transcriptional regulator